MPNWCTNTLEVTGPKPEIDRFKNAVKSMNDKGEELVFSLGSVYPMPNGLIGTESSTDSEKESNIAKYGAADWHAWRTTRWGTKWDVEPVYMEEPDIAGTSDKNPITDVTYKFDSAWSPPCEWVRHVAILFPKLHFQLDYEELGAAFKGTTLAKGDRYKDHCIDLAAALGDDDETDPEYERGS